ncbi:YbaK/EbsC family protein [Pseudomonas sp. RAC1]|uniref:YbaK/EbsC family protein n=1 Tax=Pseudomonas sp. RAC1 TaxID=3064900 RepID=UPI0027241340|nr:YbaK/EbsC family protein [Pseudomonas sp. RAC1]MDV9033398.1 YbaK/EbsC family protein [Pseudomonas sp. RAC1]
MNSYELLSLLTGDEFECPVEYHEKIYNMAESGQLKMRLRGMRCKNLLLRDKKRGLYLVVTTADKAVDLSRLSGVLGCSRLSLASTEQLFDVLKVVPGALSPLALVNDVDREITLVLDQALEGVPLYLFHPLDNGVSVQLSRQQLQQFLEKVDHVASWLDVAARC